VAHKQQASNQTEAYQESVLVAEVEMRGASLAVRVFHRRTPVSRPCGRVQGVADFDPPPRDEEIGRRREDSSSDCRNGFALTCCCCCSNVLLLLPLRLVVNRRQEAPRTLFMFAAAG
jgi:hypothetical protein